MSGAKSVRPDDEAELRERMQSLPEAVYHIPVVSRGRDALQENRDLSDVCKNKERLPVQVRDTVLNNRDDAPTSDINKQYHVANMEDKLGNDSLVNYAKADSAARERLRAISRPEPYYKRNRQHICSFYVKGLCNRGAECPFRHELPVENELSNQNINDRYHGKEDPVAKKMLGKMSEHGAGLKAPADKSITTLYITGIDDTVSEQDLRNSFSVFGQLKKVVAVHKSHCAFVTFAQRSSAEQAVTAFPTMTIRDAELRIQWGRTKPQEETAT
ncbi:Pre-mRNA-splicing factor slt11 [Gaertneriomyces sp. JEL0708]|nr:Pre-mRNA-splicing factor slt11 [Gaertneriomyces sp. JEL0708]